MIGSFARRERRARPLARRTPYTRVVAVWLLLAPASALGQAQGQPQGGKPSASPGTADYDALVRDALSEFEAGNFAEARAIFERAHAERPSARTLRGLGVTAFELKHYVQCIAELQAALVDTRSPLTDAQRSDAVSLIARAERFVGHLALTLVPQNATLLVDGREVAERTLALDLGEYHVLARADGFRDAELKVTIAGGEQLEQRMELEPIDVSPARAAGSERAGAEAAQAGHSAEPPARASSSVLRKWWFWTAVGTVAIAGVTAGVVLSQGDGAAAQERGDVGGVIVTLGVAP